MASTQALGGVFTAVLAMLRASVALTTYVGARIYPNDNGDAPARPTYPYIQLESEDETPLNTMGPVTGPKFGSEERIKVRIVTQSGSEVQGLAIGSAVSRALNLQPITVSGYASATIEFEHVSPVLRVDKAGCDSVREHVNHYLVTVHQ